MGTNNSTVPTAGNVSLSGSDSGQASLETGQTSIQIEPVALGVKTTVPPYSEKPQYSTMYSV